MATNRNPYVSMGAWEHAFVYAVLLSKHFELLWDFESIRSVQPIASLFVCMSWHTAGHGVDAANWKIFIVNMLSLQEALEPTHNLRMLIRNVVALRRID